MSIRNRTRDERKKTFKNP